MAELGWLGDGLVSQWEKSALGAHCPGQLFLRTFSGIALCVWTLVMDGMSGIYLELVFLDGFLNFGQGLFAFAIFGFETKYIFVPVKSCFRRMMYGQDSLVLPRWEDLVRCAEKNMTMTFRGLLVEAHLQTPQTSLIFYESLSERHF